jgi:hypothetical protein
MIYYKCDKKVNTIYYDKKCNVVKYGNSQNIDYDIWTCSDKMRYDIYMFFKNSDYKIAEIGSHKGYTTKILSNIFSQVYAIDNNTEWINMNKEFNKDSVITCFKYRTYMNNLAISPYFFMYGLQLQNIKRETSKKIPVNQLNQQKKAEPKEEVVEEEKTTKIDDLVQPNIFEVKTEN